MVQGFWLKKFTVLHDRIIVQLNRCLNDGYVPIWMTKGRTTLIKKDKSKGNVASNYRPITSLPLIWKLLTGIIADGMYSFLESRDLLPDEQKGCRKKSRGTHDQLFIDKMLMKEMKQRKKNVAMAWVDYKKAYDMVQHSWLEECLEIFGIADNVKKLLSNSMKTWRTELTSCGESLGDVQIKRGIFQGDLLSPLLFVLALTPMPMVLRNVRHGYEFRNREKINHLLFMDDLKLYAKNEKGLDSLIQTVHVFSSDIGMQFGIDKCATIVVKRGKVITSDGIMLPDENRIKSMNEDCSYKYLGVLESDQVKQKEMKEKLRNEYKRRVRKVLQSKLNGRNMVQAINTWAVSSLRYSAPFIEWTREELRTMDRRMRRKMRRIMMTMHKALHPRDSVCRLYLPRKEGGRGLIAVEDCIDLAKLGLERYISESDERLIIVARREIDTPSENEEDFKRRMKMERKAVWKEKALHGQHLRQTENIASKDSWIWLANGNLKKETEGLLIAAQDQALRTNVIKAKIDKSRDDPKCRMCKEGDESVTHIISQCKKLAQTEYKIRHDNVAKAVHWELCKKNGLDHVDKWYDHEPESVMENEECKILWDFTIQTDRMIGARRPDITIVNKETRECQLIDIACPGDNKVAEKENEKIDKYRDLAREVSKL